MFGKLLCLFFPILFGYILVAFQPKLPAYISNDPDWRFRLDTQIMIDLRSILFPLFELSEQHGYGEYYRNANGFYKILTKIRDLIHSDHQSCPSEDLVFDGVPVRIYFPKSEPVAEKSSKTNLLPALFFIHGGGWCTGDRDIYDDSVRTLAKALGLVTVSVDYRLGPEHPHPAQLADVTTAFRYFVTHANKWGVDSERIAVAGDSAGGHLTLTLALRWKRYLAEQQAKSAPDASKTGRLPAIKFMIPIYPVTQAVNLSTLSYRAHANDLLLSKESMSHYFACYLFGRDGCQAARSRFFANDFSDAATQKKAAELLALTPELEALIPKEERELRAGGGDAGQDGKSSSGKAALDNLKKLLDEEVSPLFAQDLTGLPQALVVTAGYDVLRDDGLAMVKRLREARAKGKEATSKESVGHLHYAQRFHGWFSLRPEELSNDIREYIKKNKVL